MSSRFAISYAHNATIDAPVESMFIKRSGAFIKRSDALYAEPDGALVPASLPDCAVASLCAGVGGLFRPLVVASAARIAG